jgi:hypothetical protein
VGSIGNLSGDAIKEMMSRVLKSFHFDTIEQKEKVLTE